MNIYRNIATLLLASAACMVSAGPIDQARQLYNDGDYEAVVEKMRPVVKRSPRDGNANYFLGASLYALGQLDEAVKPLTTAEGRGVADAARILTIMALDRYDASDASVHIDAWEAALAKSKKPKPEEFEFLNRRMIQMGNMLDRVERIEVIDSINVDSATFFEVYRLSPAAGSILPPDAVSRLGAGDGADELSVAYMPENRSELLWAAADTSGCFNLYGADILDDGSIAHSTVLDDGLREGGDARFPFLMPDGMTLYFANNGENSLGGYDIFMTRRSDGDAGGKEYFQPQNVGMPYNSPYNDFMMAIDETSGLGWWATDRNRIPGKVTVYVFIPSQMRVNVEPDNPDLGALARLSSIAMTQKEGVDYAGLLRDRLPEQGNPATPSGTSAPAFALDMGNGKIYYSLKDFKNDRARAAMLEALATDASLRKQLTDEEVLRERYRKGDHSVSRAILDSERQTAQLRRRSVSQRNNAVRLEKQ